MTRIDGILCDKPPDGRTRSGWRAFLAAVGARLQDSSVRRPRRVLLLVIVLWVLNAFDLKFTLLAQHIGGFIEMNPLARMFVSDSGALIAYKFALIIPATVIFLALRRRLITEVGCWLLLAAHVALAFIWREYYMPM